MAFCLQSCLNSLWFFHSRKFGSKSYRYGCVTELYLLLGNRGEGKLGESFLFPHFLKTQYFCQ